MQYNWNMCIHASVNASYCDLNASYCDFTVTVTVTDCLLKNELQKSSHPSPVVSRLLRRTVQSSPT